MTMQAFEGFENLAVADLALMPEWLYPPPVTGASTLPAGRLGGSAFRYSSAASNFALGTNGLQAFQRVLYSFYTVSNVYTGFAARCVTLANANNLLTVRGEAARMINVFVQTNGAVTINQDSVLVPLASSAVGIVTAGAWNYFEVRVDISGLVQVRLNGNTTPVVSFSGSIANGNSSITRVGLGVEANSSATTQYPEVDDWYITDSDTTFGQLTGFLGDCRVITRLPTGISATLWAPSGAGANWEQVNEATQNGDTNYVSDSGPGNGDQYTSSTPIPGSPTSVFGVGARMWARKNDANARRAVETVVYSGLSSTSSFNRFLSTNYLGFSEYVERNPATGLPWSKAEVESSRFGPRLAT